jgi:hypothetical protein
MSVSRLDDARGSENQPEPMRLPRERAAAMGAQMALDDTTSHPAGIVTATMKAADIAGAVP